MSHRMICCLEVIDLLTDKKVFLTEDFTSLDGYIYENTSDINDVIQAYNSDIKNDGFRAVDVFRVQDYFTGEVIWERLDE